MFTDDLIIIDENYNGESSAFVGILHESGEWDRDQFNQLDYVVYELTKQSANDSKLDRLLTQKIVNVYLHIILCITSHYNNNDAYEIKNLNIEEMRGYLEKTKLRLEFYVSGSTSFDENYFEEPNPLILSK
jgi:hypothetical protein